MKEIGAIIIILTVFGFAATIWAIIFGLLLTQIRDEIIKLRREIYGQGKQ